MKTKGTEAGLTARLAHALTNDGFSLRTPLLIARKEGEVEFQIRCSVREEEATGRLLATLIFGIRFESVEAFLNAPDSDSCSPTIANPLGSLIEPSLSDEWDLTNSNADEFLLESIKKFGIPFFSQFSTLEKFCSALERDSPGNWCWLGSEGRAQKLAVILTLLGRTNEAIHFLDNEIKRREKEYIIAPRNRLKKLRQQLLDSRPTQ